MSETKEPHVAGAPPDDTPAAVHTDPARETDHARYRVTADSVCTMYFAIFGKVDNSVIGILSC